MRKHIKNQLQDILNSLCELHNELLNKNIEDIIDSLQDCQQAAIVVGETLEQSVAAIKNESADIISKGSKQDVIEVNQAISLLEKYCEELFLLSQEEFVLISRVDRLDSIINQVKERIGNLKTTYQIVFLPYKAEMWDSLESIWCACQEDEQCEAVVVPIPYYRYDAKSKETVVCYDGDKFPQDVPVVSYTGFSLQNEMPDVAYVHNPYDDGNLVTSVHPGFYSSELKKYVGKLVYVPYYVTTGGISPEHLLLPVYLHMDYMVVQSQYFKDGCREMFYYDRVLPLGSPKLDKVIRLCQKGKNELMPVEWRTHLEGKRTLMLNTSLNCFLQQGELYLQKISSLFQWVRAHNEVAIVWRPHPLLEATIYSLRPQLLKKYQDLKVWFESENIGVFDDTPDVERTVAIVDGYIGEESTSIVNLFGAAGKPLFILNNFIYENIEKDWKRKIRIADMIYTGGKWYLTTGYCNGLFSIESESKKAENLDWGQIQYEGRVERQPRWYASNPSYGNKIFFLQNKNDAVWEYCVTTKEWVEHKECISELRKGITPEKYNRFSDISDYVQEEEIFYMIAPYTNRILSFNMENSKYRIHEVGNSDYAYSAITGSNGTFWLAEAESGKLIKWDKAANLIREFEMPKEFTCFTRFDGIRLAHNRIFEMGQWIVTVPAFSNCMVKVDKLTQRVSLCAKELWKNAGQPCNDYHPQFYTTSGFAGKIDGNVLRVQRTSDDALIELRVDTEEFSIHYPAMTTQALDKLLKNEDGFERPNPSYSAFAKRESRLFSMEDFMEDLVSDNLKEVRERQLLELSEFAVNLDGSCGEKVHRFMMNVLSNDKM